MIADFETWVTMGAPDPRVGDHAPKAGAAISEQARSHWAFQPVSAPPVPSVKKIAWVMTDIDRFILAKLEAAKIAPANMADERTWLRRATFDLIGLPPTSDDVATFAADHAATACATVIDRLLASPAYGERWGRHWLDVARYADSKGYVFEEDRAYPHAYTYRDWVIKALARRRFVWVQFHWTAKEESSEQEARRRARCLLERMCHFLLSPQRLRASCSIFSALMSLKD